MSWTAMSTQKLLYKFVWVRKEKIFNTKLKISSIMKSPVGWLLIFTIIYTKGISNKSRNKMDNSQNKDHFILWNLDHRICHVIWIFNENYMEAFFPSREKIVFFRFFFTIKYPEWRLWVYECSLNCSVNVYTIQLWNCYIFSQQINEIS